MVLSLKEWVYEGQLIGDICLVGWESGEKLFNDVGVVSLGEEGEVDKMNRDPFLGEGHLVFEGAAVVSQGMCIIIHLS